MHPLVRNVLLGSFGAAVFFVTAAAQTRSILGPPSEANHFIETPKGWVHPKTAWGEPDLEGTYPIPAGINLVRSCPRGGGPGGGAPAPAAAPCDPQNPPAWLTEEQWAARQKQLAAPDTATTALEAGNFGRALLSGVTDPQTAVRQTSTIVDPPNGQLPALTPEGLRRSALMKSSWALPGEVQSWDAPEDFDSWDRCITRGMPTSMMAYRYNSGFKIFQAPGMVAISLEMIHEDRIVYTDGRAPLKPVHKHYMGEPRGRWEGNTLVIETTNFTDKTPYRGSSDQLTLVERFTPLGPDTVEWAVTFEDPHTWARPWTFAMNLTRDATQPPFEYACHEGNYGLRNILAAARAEERAAAGK